MSIDATWLVGALGHSNMRRATDLLQQANWKFLNRGRLRLKCDGTRAKTRFRLSAKRTSPFKPAGASVQSTTGSRSVRISGSNVRYIMFQGSVKSTGYLLHSPVSPSLLLPCVAVCHHISTGLYQLTCICKPSSWYAVVILFPSNNILLQ
jgi:hypothetical protein